MTSREVHEEDAEWIERETLFEIIGRNTRTHSAIRQRAEERERESLTEEPRPRLAGDIFRIQKLNAKRSFARWFKKRTQFAFEI